MTKDKKVEGDKRRRRGSVSVGDGVPKEEKKSGQTHTIGNETNFNPHNAAQTTRQ